MLGFERLKYGTMVYSRFIVIVVLWHGVYNHDHYGLIRLPSVGTRHGKKGSDEKYLIFGYLRYTSVQGSVA